MLCSICCLVICLRVRAVVLLNVACCFNLDVCLRSFTFAVRLLLGLLLIVVGYYFVLVWGLGA